MPAQTALIRRQADEAALLPARHADGRALAERLAGKYRDRVTGQFVLPAREGRYEALPDDLPAALAMALRSRGIERLYSHQAEAWRHAQAGDHLAVVTPTASGKSLCYTLPVLSAQLVLLFASLIWGVFAWRQWRHQASGRLRWMPDPADPPGWGWFWCEAGASLPCAVRGVIDLRSAWLVRLGGQGWTRWVWLSESSDPVHWLDLRRAVWASRGNPEILDRSVIFPRA